MTFTAFINNFLGHVTLFTQRKPLNEKATYTVRFNLVSGLLLASIWLSEYSWNPINHGFEDFISTLRKSRKNKQSEILLDISIHTESIQTIIDSLSSQSENSRFANKLYQMALTVNDELVKFGTNPPNYPLPPAVPKPLPIYPTDQGDDDVWKVGKKVIIRPVVTQRPPVLNIQRIVLRTPAVQEVGVDNAESGITATIVKVPATSSSEESPDLPLQKWQVLDARFATEFDNQFLPHSWEVLNEYEVNSITGTIKSILINPSASSEIKIGALIAGLSIMTERSPEELAQFGFIRSKPDAELTRPTILLGNACWYSTFPQLERFEPNEEQKLWLRPVGEGCYLPLPTELLSALYEFTKTGEILCEALNYSAAELDKLVKEFCSHIRKNAKSRANVSWLRSIMFHKMFAISGDDVGSIATLGKTEHAPSAGLYYVTFEQEKWRGIYSHAIKDLSFTPSIVDVIEQLPYGSRQYPYEEKLQKWLGAFIQLTETQCKKAKSLAELVEAHNFYASYTFLMLLSSTGHRPADMFSFSITSIDIEDGWIIISDKITSPSTRVRLIPLTQLVIKQLKSYLIHLRNLSNRVQAAFPEQAEKISMIVKEPVHPLIPLFFWLDQSLNISAIDIPSFRNKLNWPYEGNVFRHYLKLFDILKGCAKIIAVGGFIDNLPQQIN